MRTGLRVLCVCRPLSNAHAAWEERTIPYEPDRAPLCVLLVDDDSVALELVSLLLSVNGDTVIPASGGQQALEALAALSSLPDIVLVDHQMPVVGGTEVARHVKSLPKPRPRVFAMSASPLAPGELALFDGFLLKPVTAERLEAVLHDVPQRDHQSPHEASGSFAPLDVAIVQRLQALMSGDALQEIYSVFVSDARRRIEELERCRVEQDEEGLRRCAHALKGAAGMVGAPGIASIAAGLEAGRYPQGEYASLFGELRTACDDVERTMTSSAVPGEAR